MAGSPAIDAVTGTCPPPATDQRGETRPQGAACDIGSFEVMAAPSPDLAVSKEDSPDPVLVSDHLTYTITVNNSGQGDATGVTLTDTLPTSGITFVSVSPSGSCGESGGTVDCDLGALASSEDATVTIVVEPTATGTLTNRVTVESAETDENLDNNTDTETTTVNELLCNGLVPTRVGTPGNDLNLRGTNGPHPTSPLRKGRLGGDDGAAWLVVVGLAFSAAPAYKASNVLHGLSAPKQELFQWAQSTAPDAQFLIPPSLKTFRLHAARAVVVDWKSTPIKPAELIE